jgi:hypothetical protein
VSGQCHALAALLLGKRLGTHCIRGWVGPRAGLDWCRKSYTRTNRATRGKSLYQICYPGTCTLCVVYGPWQRTWWFEICWAWLIQIKFPIFYSLFYSDNITFCQNNQSNCCIFGVAHTGECTTVLMDKP